MRRTVLCKNERKQLSRGKVRAAELTRSLVLHIFDFKDSLGTVITRKAVQRFGHERIAQQQRRHLT